MVPQDLLITPLPADGHAEDEPLRSKLGQILLQNHGEYLLSLGLHSTAEDQLTSEKESATVKQDNNCTGQRIANREDLTKIIDRLQTNVKAVNAEISELYVNEDQGVRGVYGCWMIRWMPKTVQEIVEVRVAVVGNVDAGKSTMLGTSRWWYMLTTMLNNLTQLRGTHSRKSG